MPTDSRDQVSLILILISLISLNLFSFNWQFAVHILVSLITAAALDWFFLMFVQKKFLFPRSGIVTGLLIGLILDPSTPVWLTLTTVAFAIISKTVITTTPQRHLFNPAAFGLILTQLIFSGPVSWWGVAANTWSIPILIVGLGLILFRLRLWLLPLQFLIIYAAYFRRFLDPTILLFTFVMLPEPQTLPLTFHWRRVFGFLTGITLILILPFTPRLNLDPLLLSLLIANFVGFLLTKFTLFYLRSKPQTSRISL